MAADRPIECRTLTVIRESRSKKKNWLARKLGISPGTYYAYENGKEKPSRELLERAAVALDLSSHHVDRTHDYLLRTDAEAQRAGSAGLGAEAEREIDRLADSLGLEWQEVHRSIFQRTQRLARAVAEREMARVHFPRLRAYATAAERQAIVRENKTFQTWAMSELAAHESIEAAAGDPDEALAWADLAVLIADLLPGDEPLRLRSQGYAAVHRGNAFRVKGRLRPDADEEFERGKALWKAGEAGDPERLLDEARVLGMEASLKRAHRQFPEALDLLKRALAVDNGKEKKFLLVNRANVLEEMGGFEEALATLRQLLPLIDAEREPLLFWSIRFNILVNLCHLGRHAAAAEDFKSVQDLAIRYKIGMVRLGWLRGWVANGLGESAEAETVFEQVRREFLARGMPVDLALASLELAVLFKEQGRTAEVQVLARELAPVFESQKISREALATLTLFRQAVDQETFTLEMARGLLGDFRRLRSLHGCDPAAGKEPGRKPQNGGQPGQVAPGGR